MGAQAPTLARADRDCLTAFLAVTDRRGPHLPPTADCGARYRAPAGRLHSASKDTDVSIGAVRPGHAARQSGWSLCDGPSSRMGSSGINPERRGRG